MSRVDTVFTVTTPDVLTLAAREEKMTLHGYVCPYCHGDGYFEKETGREKYKQESCPVCRGAGKLQADIVVRWEPDGMVSDRTIFENEVENYCRENVCVDCDRRHTCKTPASVCEKVRNTYCGFASEHGWMVE